MKLLTFLTFLLIANLVGAQPKENWYSNTSQTTVSIEDEGIFLSRIGYTDRIKFLTYKADINREDKRFSLIIETVIHPDIDYSSIERIYVGYAFVLEDEMNNENIFVSMFSKGNHRIIGSSYLFNSIIDGDLPKNDYYRLIITCIRVVYGKKSIETYNDKIIKQFFNGDWYFQTDPTVIYKIKGH